MLTYHFIYFEDSENIKQTSYHWLVLIVLNIINFIHNSVFILFQCYYCDYYLLILIFIIIIIIIIETSVCLKYIVKIGNILFNF